MQSDPFLDFHRTAESAGYPAMLIVSVFALGLVEFWATLADGDEPPPPRQGTTSPRRMA